MSTSELIIIALLAANTLLLAMLAVRPHKAKAVAPAPPAAPPTPQLEPAEMEKLHAQAAAAFEAAVNEATKRFGTDLDGTSKRLNQLIVTLTTDIVERELDQYKQSLAAARKEALDSLAHMQQAVEERQKSLEADVDGALAQRRQYLIEQLDHRLGAAVTAYIVESLGQGADLGAQRSFLLDSLNRHKADLKKDLADGL